MNSSAEPLAFDIVARIAECAPELRSAERKVAALILDDLTGASRASIGELAQAAAVGQRFLPRGAPAVSVNHQETDPCTRILKRRIR